MSEPITRPNCRFPSCRNTNSFLRCDSCHSVWYCGLPHARIDSSRHREECYTAILEREHLFTSLARNFLYTFVVHFAFQRWYLKRYSWQASIIIGEVEFRNQDRWEINVSRLTVVWDLVRIGGALSVPLPIALLQLPVAFGNTTLRIIAISAFLLAASSLVSASVFIASKEHLLTSATKREKWIDASICPKLFLSIDFWSCLSWPITSFVWSILLSLLAVVSLAIISEPDPTPVATKIGVSPPLIMVLVVTVIFVISYRVFSFLWRKN